MSVVIGSIFRDSTGYLDRYFAQVQALAEHVSIKLVVAEGDSTDGTFGALADALTTDDTLLKVDHGGPKYGSVDHADRWWRIAKVCNAVMAAIPPGMDVIYVESDIIWDASTMLGLLNDLREVPAVAPMCFQGERFYDVWGHRGLDGRRFDPWPPYHPALEATTDRLVPIASAGSCIVMRADVAGQVRFGINDCIIGLGRDLQQTGGLYLDRELHVTHPLEPIDDDSSRSAGRSGAPPSRR